MLQLIVSILTAIISFVLGLFVLQKNWKSATNVYFALLIFFISIYPIFNYLSLNSDDPHSALLWSKFILFSAIPVGPLFLFFVQSFPNHKFIFNKKIQIFLTVWLFFNIFLAYTGFIFKEVVIENGNLSLTPGPGVVSFALLQIIGIVSGIVSLFRKYDRAKGKERLQLQYISFGIFMSFGLMLVATVILPLLLGSTFLIAISPIFLLIGGISIAYSIIKHRLLDIRLALVRGVSFTILVLLIGVLYSSFFFFLAQTLLEVNIQNELLGMFTVLSLIVAFIFQPTMRGVQRLTNRFFFKDFYDSNKLLYEANVIMAATLYLEDVVHLVLQKILFEMKIRDGSFVLTSDNKIYLVAGEGDIKKHPVYDEVILQELLDQKNTYDVNSVTNPQLKKMLKEFDTEVVVTLYQEGKHIGWIMLGPKLSGEMYSYRDFEVLEILAPEIAVAIQNAKAYEEIRRFNITLEDEVDDATLELQKANMKLQELDKLKDEFVSVASHELRTPMTAIKSYLWMAIEGKGGELTQKQKYYLERAYSSTDRLIKLVNEMLNISRIESGRISLQVEKVELFQILEEVIAEVQPRADELKLDLKLKKTVKHGNETLKEVWVVIDTDKIKEVLINLIGNSLKFTPKLGEIKVYVEIEKNMATVSIADTGVGIDPQYLSALFQKFGLMKGSYQTNQEAAQGTGLGLYISKSIIELHGGEIKGDSKGKGKGATFSFSIPLYTSQKMKKLQEQFKETNDAGIIRNTV